MIDFLLWFGLALFAGAMSWSVYLAKGKLSAELRAQLISGIGIVLSVIPIRLGLVHGDGVPISAIAGSCLSVFGSVWFITLKTHASKVA